MTDLRQIQASRPDPVGRLVDRIRARTACGPAGIRGVGTGRFESAAMGAPLLIDDSAWARIMSGGLPAWRTLAFVQELEERHLGVCLSFMAGTAASAVNAEAHDEVMTELEELPHFPIDEEVERWARGARRRLARARDHRTPSVKVIIAATAHHFGTGVLHYDSDYDVIFERTNLDFESRWLMPAGSLD